MIKTVLIFDLDGTICKDTLNTKSKVEFILHLIRDAVYNRNGSVYVVTARRLSDFDNNEMKLLSYRVPKEIVELIKTINKNKHERWLYYNDNDDHSNYATFDLLTMNNKFDEYETFIHTSYKILQILHLNLGIQKMRQIEDILKKYKGCNLHLFFFDDASHNKHAWLFYTNHINPAFKDINFIGGDDQPVF